MYMFHKFLYVFLIVIRLADYLVVNALERMIVGSVSNLVSHMTELFSLVDESEPSEEQDGFFDIFTSALSLSLSIFSPFQSWNFFFHLFSHYSFSPCIFYFILCSHI